MKLKTSTSPIRLSLRALSQRMAMATLSIRLQTAVLSQRLVVAVGDFLLVKLLTDTATITESLRLAMTKSLSDSALASEIKRITFSKKLADSASADDGTAFYFAENYFVDNLDYVFSIGRFYTLSKAIPAEPVTASEDYAAAMAKILTDTPLASSAGFLNNQNYVAAPAYFSEDYIGESRAFS